MEYYPIFLNLSKRPVVVVGGGKLAHEKVGGLLRAEARVTVIAAALDAPLRELAAVQRVEHLAREYQVGDLAGAFLVISTLQDAALNDQIYAEAAARRIPVNVVDDVPHCSFIAPSILRQGDLCVAISTSGKAPAVAVRLRQQLEKQLGPEYAQLLEIAGTLRAPLASKYPDFETRKNLWYELVDSDVLGLLRAGDETAAHQRISEIMDV